jgi:para-nitrobenzyl esterase
LDGSYSQQPPPTTPQQRLLAQRMIGYWTRFAKTSDPNTPGLPHWPSYQADGPVLSLTAAPNGIEPTNFAAAHHCTFWNTR